MPSRADLPLIRRHDHKIVGTLSIIRANHPAFTDEHGERRADPVWIDQSLVTLTDAKGETVCSIAVPMDRLPADEP